MYVYMFSRIYNVYINLLLNQCMNNSVYTDGLPEVMYVYIYEILLNSLSFIRSFINMPTYCAYSRFSIYLSIYLSIYHTGGV